MDALRVALSPLASYGRRSQLLLHIFSGVQKQIFSVYIICISPWREGRQDRAAEHRSVLSLLRFHCEHGCLTEPRVPPQAPGDDPGPQAAPCLQGRGRVPPSARPGETPPQNLRTGPEWGWTPRRERERELTLAHII